MRFHVPLVLGLGLCAVACSKGSASDAPAAEAQPPAAVAPAPQNPAAQIPVNPNLQPKPGLPGSVPQVPGNTVVGTQPPTTVPVGTPPTTVPVGAAPTGAAALVNTGTPVAAKAVPPAGGTGPQTVGRGIPAPPGGRPKPGTK